MKLIVFILTMLSITAAAQTVIPVTAEYGKGRARGAFAIRNNSLRPESVTVELRSVIVDENGKPDLKPLDAGAHVQLAETSARVSAGQQHSFAYDIRCDSYPCAVAMLAAISGPHRDDGLVIRLILAHTAYVCAAKEKGCRAAALRLSGK